jgi:hypothetical protein
VSLTEHLCLTEYWRWMVGSLTSHTVVWASMKFHFPTFHHYLPSGLSSPVERKPLIRSTAEEGKVKMKFMPCPYRQPSFIPSGCEWEASMTCIERNHLSCSCC